MKERPAQRTILIVDDEDKVRESVREVLADEGYRVVDTADGSRVLDLSTKCAPSEALQVAAETRAFLADRDVPLSGEQEPKTRKALDFFSAELAAAR